LECSRDALAKLPVPRFRTLDLRFGGGRPLPESNGPPVGSNSHMQRSHSGLGDACRRGPDAALGCAWFGGLPPAALWIALTALDGRTYHLAPIVVAAAPGIAARALGLSISLVSPSLIVVGIVTTGLAWAVIELIGVAPSATLWHGQPGGVRAEVVVATIVGALLGALAVRAPGHHAETSRAHREIPRDDGSPRDA
jgi:hypothetical protein